MEHEIELQIMPSGNVAVYRGNGFIPTEKLTEEERLFVLDKVIKELDGEHKVKTRDSSLEDEIKRYTEEKYHETFGNGQGTLDEFDWEDIAMTIEETAVHFVGWKEEAPEYKTISKILALSFMHFLDENRPEGKMCLSNGECADIEKAFNEHDWSKLLRYLDKYLVNGSSSEIPTGLEEAADDYAVNTASYYYDDEEDEVHSNIDELKPAFIAGAKWHADHTPLPEDTVLFNKGVAEGKRLMMEEAVEKTVFQITRERTPVIMLTLDANEYKDGDKVHVIVIKEN